MASQGEREPGVVEMDEGVLESMVQDGDPEQDIGVQEQISPQTDPEPEMGAAAAAAYDTSPPPLRQNPPIRLEQSAVDMILQAINEMNTNAQQMGNEIRGMNEKMDTNAQQMKNEMDGMNANMNKKMEEGRGEMQKMGHGLQAGIMAFASDEMWTAGRKKMATPHAGTNELGGSATAVRAAVAAGEDRVIRETSWARCVKVTETVTQGGKLMGMTETCTSETRRQVTELTETREMVTVEERLHGMD